MPSAILINVLALCCCVVVVALLVLGFALASIAQRSDEWMGAREGQRYNDEEVSDM